MSLIETIRETEHLAFAGRMGFPEVVARLSAEGVERYCADLDALRKTFHTASGVTIEELRLTEPPAIAQAFSPDAVIKALEAIKQGQIQYPEFLRRIMAGGCICYLVFLAGRKTIYFGRHGDFHVEDFNAPKQ